MTKAGLVARMFVLAAMVIAMLVAALPVGAAGGPFNVDSTDDAQDATVGDGLCLTAQVDPHCTLRAAIQEANFDPDADTIIGGRLHPEPRRSWRGCLGERRSRCHISRNDHGRRWG